MLQWQYDNYCKKTGNFVANEKKSQVFFFMGPLHRSFQRYAPHSPKCNPPTWCPNNCQPTMTSSLQSQ